MSFDISPIPLKKILHALRKALEKIKVSDPEIQKFRQSLLKSIRSSQKASLAEQVEMVQKGRRLLRIIRSGIHKNKHAMDLLKESNDLLWTKTKGISTKSQNIKKVATQLFKSSNPGPREHVLLSVSPRVKEISEELIRICHENGVDFDIHFEEPHYLALLLNQLNEERIQFLAEKNGVRMNKANKVIGVRTSVPLSAIDEMDQESYLLWKEYSLPFQKRIRSGEVYFTNTRIPTPEDAKIDDISYLDYKKMYFQSCDQPWKMIEKAQAILIRHFNEARSLHVSNSDGTSLTLDIDKFTFCNSVIGKNIPGAEIFSAPALKGVNGTLVSMEKHRYKNSPVIENVRLEFREGKCISYSAEKGQRALKKILSTDPGALFVGEIGIGTNPHLRRCFTNIALTEKISGSFHIALGACYTFKKYDGQLVKVNNRNKSLIHWDITTLLRGKNGRMLLDGKLIQENGKWLIPKCEVLNEGWDALPKKDQPKWWKEHFPKGYIS